MGSVLDPENAKKHSVPTLIHEFNHSFVNPLQDIEKNAKLLGNIPQRLLEQDYNIMAQQAYPDPKTVFNESVVRAATVIYMMENGFTADEVESELMSHVMRGFKWTPELVAALRDYTSNRNKYPTLGDFYPQIAKVLKNYLDAEGQLVFKPIPMSFHDKTGKVTRFWKDYYARKGLQVPEGCPGSNPGDLSRSPKLRFLFSFR
jgi:hypothetical protein